MAFGSLNRTLDGLSEPVLAHVGTSHGLTLARWWAHWELRPELLVPVLGLGLLYGLGWWRLRRRSGADAVSAWRLTAYGLGLGLILVALLSGIDALGEQLFLMHMVQHLLLMMGAAPLLLLANPLPVLVWGLPARLRRAATRPLRRGAAPRRLLAALATPQVSLVAYIGLFWLWHVPAAYDAALTQPLVHDLEHVSFFGTAMLFWWHVVGAAPRLHGAVTVSRRLVMLLVAFAFNEILAVAISFAAAPIYPYYAAQARSQGISVMDDQMIGGAIMWIPGGMMYGLAAILLIAGMLDRESRAARAIAPPTVDASAVARV
ncbi:MAG: cytochrome c oxidase assembly protein [Chloroflexi bacterium]|nr:cytochrome c oxidase assembly protein [Chloroflexota bacterium]